MQSPPNPLATLLQAVAFAADKHRNQRRKDAEASPYINHPIALANVLANEGGVQDVTVLCAAVLHDTIEDTETTADELRGLFGDEVVCLVSRDHPAVRRGWDVKSWLEAEHIAPTPTHLGAKGVIEEHLEQLGLQRNIMARCPHFGLIPAMVASSLLVLTTGRQYCERYSEGLPLKILPCPIEFPRMMYYQLWHERSHASNSAKWLRERVKAVAMALKKEEPKNG